MDYFARMGRACWNGVQAPADGERYEKTDFWSVSLWEGWGEGKGEKLFVSNFAVSGWRRLKGWNGTLLVRLLFVMFLPEKSEELLRLGLAPLTL